MKNHFSTNRTVVILTIAATFLAITESAAFAQRSRPVAVERRIERINSQLEQNERDNLSREKDSRTENRTKALAEEQIRKDLEGVQTDYNRLVIAMAEKQKTDYDSIFRTVAEINKRAVRLKENLALPKAKEEKNQNSSKADGGSENLNESLLQLRKHVYNFVTNSIFEAPTVLDVEQAKKASRDLELIIEVSKNIGKKEN